VKFVLMGVGGTMKGTERALTESVTYSLYVATTKSFVFRARAHLEHGRMNIRDSDLMRCCCVYS
jgi:hypothetical protein